MEKIIDTSTTTKKSGRYWPLWIPMIILLLYILVPLSYTVYYVITDGHDYFWDFDLTTVPMIIMAILMLIAWWKPVLGGTLILITSAILCINGISAPTGGDGGGLAFLYFMAAAVILAIPGILFLIFGIFRRHKYIK